MYDSINGAHIHAMSTVNAPLQMLYTDFCPFAFLFEYIGRTNFGAAAALYAEFWICLDVCHRDVLVYFY